MEDLSVYNPEGSVLRRAQHRMVEILKAVDTICREEGITYFLDGGSLIGAVRHGGFIPWDDDLDIAVMREDYPRLRAALLRKLPKTLVLQDYHTDPNYPMLIAKVRDKNSYFEQPDMHNLREQGIYIDIIPMEKIPSLKWKKKIDYWYGHCLRAWHNYTTVSDKLVSALFFPVAWIMLQLTRFANIFSTSDQIAHAYGWGAYGGFSKQDVFPVVDMKFEDMQVMVPKNSHAVLTALFGDYMQIPPKEKRPQHAGKIEIYK